MSKTRDLKIVFFDIETTPLVITKFQYDKNPYIRYEDILEDWYIICAAWKTLGEKKTSSVKISKLGDDYNVVKTLRAALSEADLIVGHAIDRFDIRNLNARLLYHNLPPLPNIPTVDTLKVARRVAGFSSNRLDYLSKILNNKEKMKVDGSLWRGVMDGSKEALNKMVKYNIVDVIRDEEVYLRLRPFMKTHPHVGVMKGDDRLLSCPKCGSTKIKRNGIRVTAAGIKKQEVQCQSCGGFHRIPVI